MQCLWGKFRYTKVPVQLHYSLLQILHVGSKVKGKILLRLKRFVMENVNQG